MSQLQHVGLLESLKYRMNQLIESIGALQYLIHNNNTPAMPPWPDILARYNLLLSQIHGLFNALSYVPSQNQQSQQDQASQQHGNTRSLQNLVVHPTVLITQYQLDHGLQQLFRTTQTLEVLNEEDSIVRKIAAVLKTSTPEGVPLHPGPEGCMRVVHECAEIKLEHDARVQRAVRAVTLLRDKYDWHARVEVNGAVEEEEGEELGQKDEPLTIVDVEMAVANTNEGGITTDASAPDLSNINDLPTGRNSEASTPSPTSVQSDAINEAVVTRTVLGELN